MKENERRNEEIQERRRQEQITEQERQEEIAEQKRQEEIAEQKRQEEIELKKLEYEERKRKDEMEFELQKIRLGAEGSSCPWKISVAQKLELAVNKIYGFGNQNTPALASIGRIKADIEVDNVKAESISIYVVPDDAQSVDLIIGRTSCNIRETWLDLPNIAYAKIGKRVHMGYREDELFRNFPINEQVI
ncbi:hypothetical protein AVEN_82074-1 [Araneus ventricosus]|uniref:Uncharacterized protein n=1 Tax=Araneus ventricosus TaxID=182803 RepID=A0A4Y2N2K0_ARAVE|nr:hypothetical protein AVEN_82074-1 [Araneus ventricosus]